MNLRILHEDEHVIVCYKPAGIATQTAKMGSQDMESLLKNYLYKKERKMPYIAVIHRLDQPVEGVLVFAKTPFAAKELNKGLQGAGFGKYYKAVVCGIPKEQKATLEDYLVKDGKTNSSRVAAKDEAEAKKAVLAYEVLKQTEDKSLLKIKLETGRHHQIRVQMAHMGCPIWGDTKYNSGENVDKSWKNIALCAYHLEFVHPKTKKKMVFEVEPEGEGFQL
jgi:23S rRNA pseudouridine1911/1915/1917 synthase